MKLVIHTDDNTLTLNYTWLPTWIGMNTSLMKDIEEAAYEKFSHRPINDKLLREIEEWVILDLCKRTNMRGLDELLRSIRDVEHEEDR